MSERKKPSRPLSPWFFALAAAAFLVQALPGLWENSLTNDEPMEISNGYFYLVTGDVTSHHRHPPFGVGLQAAYRRRAIHIGRS